MKYETPELTALTPAINAIQGNGIKNRVVLTPDSKPTAVANEHLSGYADWE